MFDKAKKLYDLKRQADSVKKQMEEIFVEIEERGVAVKMRGDNRVETLTIDGAEDKRLKEAFNRALKETQKKVAKKMQGQMGDFGL